MPINISGETTRTDTETAAVDGSVDVALVKDVGEALGPNNATSTYFFGCEAAQYSKRALFLMQCYAAGLLVLFGEMARTKYGGSKRPKRSASPARSRSASPAPGRASPRLAARKRR